jgi:AcrR family transcriptional regulator
VLRGELLRGGRVDIQRLAARHGVTRVTLYRSFGAREQLLEQVCERLAVQLGARAHAKPLARATSACATSPAG